MNLNIEVQKITLPWALMSMLMSLIAAIGLNETIAHGRGKVIFFGIFVTSFIVKMFQNHLKERNVVVYMLCVAIFHFALIFVIPNDDQYAGGLLFPAAILDVSMFYYLFALCVKHRRSE